MFAVVIVANIFSIYILKSALMLYTFLGHDNTQMEVGYLTHIWKTSAVFLLKEVHNKNVNAKNSTKFV